MNQTIPGYIVTDEGEILSWKTFTLLAGKKDKNGYIVVNLRYDGKHVTRRRARLVCEIMHGAPLPGQQVNHINGIKHDDRPENLEWCSASTNALHAINVLKRWPNLRVTDAQIKYIRDNPQIRNKELSETLGIHNSTVSLIRNGKRR